MTNQETVAISRFPTELGKLSIAVSPKGLLYVAFPDGEESMAEWLSRHARGASIGRNRSARAVGGTSAAAEKQLTQFLSGRRREFDVPLDLRGTEFQKKVWAALCDIPFGKTTSYGELARRVGKPAASRAVGGANGRNPIPIVVPCHRVIGSDGSLTGFGGGLDLKRALLRLEGHRV